MSAVTRPGRVKARVRRAPMAARALVLSALASAACPAPPSPDPDNPATVLRRRPPPGSDPLPPRPADAAGDVAYYRERTTVLAAREGTEIARTDFVRLRRGRMYIGEARPGVPSLDAALTVAFNRRDAAAVLDLTNRILSDDLADIRAHVLRAVVLREGGRIPEANFHRELAVGLVESIVRGGDGRGFDSAWTVYRVKEEYEILKTRGYVVGAQGLQFHDGRAFDVLDARKPDGTESLRAYFDVTEMFAEEGRRMRGL